MPVLILLLLAGACSNTGSADDTAGPESTDSDSATAEQTGAEAELPGYRAGLYPTGFATERKNLNGTHELVDVGFPRDVQPDDIVIETIEMPYPALMYTREPDEIFVIGGTPLGLDQYVSFIDGLPPGDNETDPYFAKYNPETGDITYLDLDRGSGVPYLGGALVHADGYVYVVSQSHLYRVEPESMEVEASVDLPAE